MNPFAKRMPCVRACLAIISRGAGVLAFVFAAFVSAQPGPIASPPSSAPSSAPSSDSQAFPFAVVGQRAEAPGEGSALTTILHSTDVGGARFVLHFDSLGRGEAPCSDTAMENRRAALAASSLPVIAVIGAHEWSDCGATRIEPIERLNRLRETWFGSDESLGQTRLHWIRQRAMPRFQRYAENLSWQIGPVLFITLNVPANNNAFRAGAGRNGEFEERVIANRVWLERAFRTASERKLHAIVIAIDAAPQFDLPLVPPDSRSRERDGYYEFKMTLRELTQRFAGQVLLIQGHAPRRAEPPVTDHPVRDVAGRTMNNFTRMALFDAASPKQWFRIDVDLAQATPFRVTIERLFDDPSGELYGPGRVK